MRIKDIEKPKRKISFITVHCSDSDYSHHDNVETLRDWHVKGNGWNDIGYHYVITKEKPRLRIGRDIEVTPAAVYGHNSGSIAICLTGKTKFTPFQFKRLKELVEHLQSLYSEELIVYGHRELDPNRSCPNFDVHSVLG
tara:strand:+ start:2952 stop:3368 length:417 start_codon:yes stop_codon:yes gene_type:complete